MICFKGCSQEIEMLEQLIKGGRKEYVEMRAENLQQIAKLETALSEAKDIIASKDDYINKDLLPRLKILEREVLKSKPSEPVKGIGVYYNDPCSGEPLFSPDFSSDAKPDKKRKK